MIDFIKSLNIGINPRELLNNPYLEFKTLVSEKTGEINENRYVAEYKNLKFVIVNNQYVNLYGSLHKYFNNGIHNYNDFSYADLFETIKELTEKFNLNPFLTHLNNLEFSVNINTTFNPKSFIRTNIISHKGIAPSIQRFKGKGYLKEFIHSQYIIKIYDKGLQYKQPENIFRIEIKVVKMEYLKKIGLKVLADLLDVEIITKLGTILNEVFNEILIIDKIDYKILTEKEKDVYQNGINPMFWEQLKPNSENYKNGNKNTQYRKDRKKYYRELNRFKELINKYNLNRSQKELSILIQEKWKIMLVNVSIYGDKLTIFLSGFTYYKKGQIDHDSNLSNKFKEGQNNSSNIVLGCTYNIKRCKVTGLDISMQKESSEFLGQSGIEYYQIYFPEIYRELEKRLRNSKYKNADLNKFNEEITHSIRNKDSNKRNNTKRSIKKVLSAPSLFNNLELIDTGKLKIAGYI